MKNRQLQNGFSLVEVLMATGILAVGLLMVAGTFPVGIFLTAGAVEQTIAPIAADEAFAKIRLYGINTLTTGTDNLPANTFISEDFNNINSVRALGVSYQISDKEYSGLDGRVYSWSAICRRVIPDEKLVQITVFVSRKTGSGLKYYQYNSVGDTITTNGGWPTPVRINVPFVNGNIVRVDRSYITDGCTLVADVSGNIYRVLDHKSVGADVECTLDKNWIDGTGKAWIVPPPVSGGRSPVIGVYQRIIKF